MSELDTALTQRILATAYQLARKHGLEAADTIWCWNCSERPALMPSLHCPQCLAEAWRQKGIVMPACPNRQQTAEDVAACG